MKKVSILGIFMLLVMGFPVSCELLDNDMDKHVDNRKDSTDVALEDVASILAQIPIRRAHALYL